MLEIIHVENVSGWLHPVGHRDAWRRLRGWGSIYTLHGDALVRLFELPENTSLRGTAADGIWVQDDASGELSLLDRRRARACARQVCSRRPRSSAWKAIV
jgi:hypothetical protein